MDISVKMFENNYLKNVGMYLCWMMFENLSLSIFITTNLRPGVENAVVSFELCV